ncbi:hypothetical protein [Actinoplanes friuliensis]|jgi:hypothetical protein|uniref:Uncharacterized protein n=1 Tax=Actinoplanes friuliensis DSM 7358 TaxID=1246995 RepID=U5W199_9ACTN|nr:hypothetical protein [Actinoplanes friuliensis]AGZ41735.1 hypothetical protein AFR_17285 [Actinoplanes friuliensis DSM 7358]
MDLEELAQVIAEVPEIEVSIEGGLVVTRVPAIGDAVRLEPVDVLDWEYLIAPSGVPGIELEVRRGHERLPLIITVDDVVFMPAYAADMVEPDAPLLRVPSSPNLVAYSEMHRDVRALGKAIDDPALELDPETLGATLLVHRCFLAGALRAGLWPVRVAAWWEYMWARVGNDMLAGPFRADPVWDQLMADVTEARRHVTPENVTP